MWGNLAGRIAKTDLNATLEKIGNAVAPREEDFGDDEDEEEYDDDEGEYDEYEDDGSVEEVGSFGLVGMLTRALDDRQHRYDIREDKDDDEGQSELNFDDMNGKKSSQDQPVNKTPLFSSQNESGSLSAPIPHQNPPDDWSDDGHDSPLDLMALQQQQMAEEESRRMLEETQRRLDAEEKERRRVKAQATERKRVELENQRIEAQRVKEEKDKAEQEIRRKEVLAKQRLVEQDRVKIESETKKKAEAQRRQKEIEVERQAEEQEILRLEAEATRKAEAALERRRREHLAKKQTEQRMPVQKMEASKKEKEERLRMTMGNGYVQPVTMNGQDLDREIDTDRKSTLSSVDSNMGQNRDNKERPKTPEYHEATRIMETEFKCRELQTRLDMAEQEIQALQNEAKREKSRVASEQEELISRFQDKEARLLKATSEERQNETLHLEQEFRSKIEALEKTLAIERLAFKEDQEHHQRLLMESNTKFEAAESEIQATVQRFEREISQLRQQQERATRKADDRVAQTMAMLDERNEEISHLKSLIREMESKVNEHEEGVEEAEEELDELQHENDSLRGMLEKVEKEKSQLQEKVDYLEHDSEKLAALQLEMTMVKEELLREKTKNQSVVDSAMSSHNQVESERDSALSELMDVKQQLAAVLADLEVARADNVRIVTANTNLQAALEAFQDERQAEMDMLEEQRLESEEAIKSAHEAAISALKQTHDVQLYDVQKAASNTIQNVKNEMEVLEGNIERLKSENNQIRRSLDEAIHRLQSSQEDVIDRTVMKNILLDWCMLKEKSKRHQVLEVMANVLHFSEEEKEKVHLTSIDLDSVGARFVGALAAPLPPSKADVEHLEGSNVREKWINFLMAETDEG